MSDGTPGSLKRGGALLHAGISAYTGRAVVEWGHGRVGLICKVAFLGPFTRLGLCMELMFAAGE